MQTKEYILSVFDKTIAVDQGWELNESRTSGYRKSYFAIKTGAKMKVTFLGKSISLLRGSIWNGLPIKKGIDYDLPDHTNPIRPDKTIENEKYKIKIDDNLVFEINLANEHLEIPLAENLNIGTHTIEIEANSPGQTSILGFRILQSEYGILQGVVKAENEMYLNDIRISIIKEGQLYDKRLARNPFTKEVMLWGLESGSYELILEAIGWEKQILKNLIVKNGEKTKFPEIKLNALEIQREKMPTKLKRSSFFRIVKFGHLDTWTQRNAEYLASLVELTNVYDPDILMISNETNWQYVSGALNNLKLPYLITSGNHGLPGFNSFYNDKLSKIDIGPITIVVYNSHWLGPAKEVEEAFRSSPDAKFRILQGVESNIDQEWAKCLNLNLYLCAHGYKDEHFQKAPWLHLGKEFQVIDIDLKSYQIKVIKAPNAGNLNRDKYPISREHPIEPVVFSNENSGKHNTVTANVINPMLGNINDAKLCFKMPKGKYITSKGKIHSITEILGEKAEIVEVRFDLEENTSIEINVKSI